MISQHLKYNKDYNPIEYIEKDSDGEILYVERTTYYGTGGVKTIRDSNGHEREYDCEGFLINEVGKPKKDTWFDIPIDVLILHDTDLQHMGFFEYMRERM